MSIKKYFIFLILISLTSCYNTERNCKDFKTGKFEFVQTIDGKKMISTFERNDSIQIETFNGRTDTAAIRWVNDCEYILQKIHPKNMQEKKAINIRILTTNKNGYTFEYSFVNEDKRQKGSVTKLN
ncbi:MAG: hypothetical protein QM535_11000 [Limnohabitans sp.]|nr:hypothetical protein [Limnohabitans sp.]